MNTILMKQELYKEKLTNQFFYVQSQTINRVVITNTKCYTNKATVTSVRHSLGQPYLMARITEEGMFIMPTNFKVENITDQILLITNQMK